MRLATAKQQVGILEGVGRSLPNPAILLRPLRTREAVLSSRLEGTYVTARDLLLFELEGGPERSDPNETEERNDQREVSNYARALSYGMQDDRPLSKFLLRSMHEVLMTGVRGQDRHPGRFRTIQAIIGRNRQDARFVPPPPERLDECLDHLSDYLELESRPLDGLMDAFVTHYQFETIHPFEDGNGRVGRLLLALCFPRWGCLTKPWIYMSPYFERNREEYIERLFSVSTTGDWDGWIDFCLRGVIHTANETIDQCERLRQLRDEFGRRAAASGGSARLLEIVDRLFESPFIRVHNLAEQLNVTYNTIKRDCQRLMKADILEELDGLRPRTFYSPEVFATAYEVERSS